MLSVIEDAACQPGPLRSGSLLDEWVSFGSNRVSLTHFDLVLYNHAPTGNIPNDDLSLLRTHPKPLVLMMHGTMLSVETLTPQLDDPFLTGTAYIIAFDQINCGRTICPSYRSNKRIFQHDEWTDGAVIALFVKALGLPPFHLFAQQYRGVYAAKRFAILWPEQVLSLTLISVPGDKE